ncbi:MAG: hypothetical protein COV35_03055 [Alphaproteobacteria bacterium CG11_big_fil_rev_8_21_14_0_20_39_49]|nr:MAG: hypothetical protein COV35_03055 [Alphaproteobacteria bacterium CG11_big_fil_rev_8_21_14_0_20_39_49]
MKYASQAINAAFILSSSISKKRPSIGILPSRQKDNVILDGVGLATTTGVTDFNKKTFEELKEKGLDISSIKRGDKTDYRIKTTGNSYELKTLEQVDKIGLHAKSYVVNQKPISSKEKKGSDSLRIAFGGTREQDWGRTFAMHVTKLPLHYEKNLREFIDNTLETYRQSNPDSGLPENIVISGHSAGATQANKAFEILKEKGIESDVHLHLYEPFGAKFSKMKQEDQKEAVSYTGHNSFLKYFLYDGDTIGEVKALPESDLQKQVAAGKAISMSQWGILGRAMAASIKGHGIDSIIESGLKSDEKEEVELEPVRKSQSTNGIAKFAEGVISSQLAKNYSTGMFSRL